MSGSFLATSAELLSRGFRVRFRAPGKSMHPAIRDGEVITVEPVEPGRVQKGDILLYRFRGRALAHRVVSLGKGRFILRGDSSRTCDEEVEPAQVLGRVVSVEREGRELNLGGRRPLLSRAARALRARLGKLGMRAAPLALSAFLLVPAARAQMLTGSYIGNGIDNRFIGGLGFQPNVLILKGSNAQEAVGRISTMVGDRSKTMTTATALILNAIQSFQPSGFIVGTDARVNSAGPTYRWAAFRANPGELRVGAYVGNGTTQSITGLGFSPDYVIVLSAAADDAVQRSRLMTRTFSFSGLELAGADRITSLNADGFSLGSNVEVNRSGTTYHYAAWNEIAGMMDIGSYVGNGADNRNIAGTGLTPDYLIIQNQFADFSLHRTASLTGDSTLDFRNAVNLPNAIQQLQANGFQVGTHAAVNANGVTNYYMAFARLSPSAVELVSFTASVREGEAVLRWRTGFEVENLGFHLYREEGEGRVRVTPALIAGSALLAGGDSVLTAGRSYTYRDERPSGAGLADARLAGAGPVRYWLEEVDLSGKKAWHGPAVVTPAEGAGWTFERRDGLTRSAPRLELLGRKEAARAPAFSPPAPRSVLLGSGPRSVETQWALAAGPAVKISVREEGWHRVGQPELVAAGLDPSADPRFLQVHAAGVEVAIAVEGAEDGRLDPADAVEFYGLGLDTPSADRRVYWLTEGLEPGRRIGKVSVAPGPGGARSFPFTVERRERTIYFAALRNGDAENFFGPVIAAEPVEEPFLLHHVDPDPPEAPELELALQGVTHGPHRVEAVLNGTGLGEVAFEGQARGSARLAVPPALLLEGENRVTLTGGGEGDVSLLHSIRVTYRHSYTADGGSLRFGAPGGRTVRIDGFHHPGVRVIDITSPRAPRLVEATVDAAVERAAESAPGAGEGPPGEEFSVTVRLPGQGWRLALAFAPPAVRAPAAVEANLPSSLAAGGPGAEVVIVAPRAFLASAVRLAAFREEEGWSATVVDLDDIYDEFSFGAKDPSALRSFFRRAASVWRTPPRFGILLGDSSFDPRNHLGLGDFDLVPTRLVDTRVFETASDEWFGDLDGDGVAEVAMGRLPARAAGEAEALVSKTISYGRFSFPGREALLVADTDEEFDFAAATREVAARLPEGLAAREVLLSPDPASGSRTLLLSRLNEGPRLVNYLGHGSVEVWTGAGLLTSDDALALANGDRLPLFLSMTCLNGYFHDLYTECLAESLLKASGGGAVAVWASSGMTGPAGQALMNQALVHRLFSDLFSGPPPTLGEAVRWAKAAIEDPDLRRTWILFGDPTIRLR